SIIVLLLVVVTAGLAPDDLIQVLVGGRSREELPRTFALPRACTAAYLDIKYLDVKVYAMNCAQESSMKVTNGGAKRIRVGIVGANTDRGWAAQAHIPALKSLANDFEITALSTTRRESADAASKRFGVPNAFDNHQ